MAVYKATHCYPLLNNIDPRIAAEALDATPAEYLKCQIDTSNKQVTGYKIRLLDSNNNVIFPVSGSNIDINNIVSPISELSGIQDSSTDNTGYNGTVLKIPFFQNKDTTLYTSSGERKLVSYQSILYKPAFKACYVWPDDTAMSSWTVSSGNLIPSDEWDGKIEGEYVQEGDTVFIGSMSTVVSSNYRGIWYLSYGTGGFPTLKPLQINGTTLNYTTIEGTPTAEVPTNRILITRGTSHGTVYECQLGTTKTGASYNKWVDVSDKSQWEDIDGNAIDLSVDGSGYKWEITLYQGDGELSTGNPVAISYANLANGWYDITLQQGTILGSTNERIQLSDDNETVLPNNGSAGDLVLQGKYVQLYDSSNNQLNASRGYIQTYDSTYGHIYPLTGSFTKSQIDQASYVKVFKYSNDPDAIEASDQVNCATTANLKGLFGYTGDTANVDLVIRVLDPTDFIIDGVTLTKGMTVLVLDSVLETTLETPTIYTATKIGDEQVEYDSGTKVSTDKVYEVTQGTAYTGSLIMYKSSSWEINQDYQATGLPRIDGFQTVEGSRVLVKEQTDNAENGIYIAHSFPTRWTRSGSYNSWSNFIGKVIYVADGTTNGGKNFKCRAQAGGTLKTTDVITGDSSLLFGDEPAIILFGNNFSVEASSVDLYSRSNLSTETKVDKVVLTDGMTILVCGLTETGGLTEGVYTCHVDTAGNISFAKTQTLAQLLGDKDSVLIEIANGGTYGDSVMQIEKKISSTGAIVYQLTTNIVSAYLAKILKNTTEKTFITPYTGLTQDMRLKMLNGSVKWLDVEIVNKTVWSVTHDALETPMASFTDNEAGTPYTYEVRSYFRVSDENPFYCYEPPHLIISSNDTDVANVYSKSELLVPQTVTLDGSYVQYGEASWESCRWVLTDVSGNVVWDTGKKYDNKMSVSLYGLSNETDDDRNIYYCYLYVLDELNNELNTKLKLSVKSKGTAFSTEFNASYDHQTQSVLLECPDISGIIVNEGYSLYRREYKTVYRYENGSKVTKTIKGEWEPVDINFDVYPATSFKKRDFNISCGRSYQYCLRIKGLQGDLLANDGQPVRTCMDFWSIAELTPVDIGDTNTPMYDTKYKVDLNNIWLFKYSLETGSQTQNFTKNEYKTMGQFGKFGFSQGNSISGSISCLLGSEIIPYSKYRYIERPWLGISDPSSLSTNEKIDMLQLWRALCFSKNPKLLKDNKGQAWIVQITSNTNTPKTFYSNQPDSISFSWKQVDDVKGCLILGSGDAVPELGSGVWEVEN